MEGRLLKDDNGLDYVKNDHYINGLGQYTLDMKCHIPLSDSNMCHIVSTSDSIEEIVFDEFGPGSIIIYE